MAEVQITPKSPIAGAAGGIIGLDLEEKAVPDYGASRRIRPGTKAADMAAGPPLIPLSEVRTLLRDYILQKLICL
jgi:hypothetical protein